MINISLDQIDSIRQQGYRPGVVGCFVNEKKILLVFEKKYELWQLPQGGIQNKEEVETAFWREMSEELGQNFLSKINQSLILIGQDSVTFPPEKQNGGDLKNDNGHEVPMQGKYYLFVYANSFDQELNSTDTQFDEFKWLTYDEAVALAETIYQHGKKRITLNALKTLKDLNLL